jgi:hypothetical protein
MPLQTGIDNGYNSAPVLPISGLPLRVSNSRQVFTSEGHSKWKRKNAAALRKLAQQILAARKLVNLAYPNERKMLPRLY